MTTESHDDSSAAKPVALGSTDGLGRAPERDDLCAALRSYQQADADGVMVLVSRQAVCEAALEIESLRAALQWYADGEHFEKAEPDAWDTVSGEPQNWWCDEAGTAMVEDGTLAGMVLAGQLTGQKLHALEDGEEA